MLAKLEKFSSSLHLSKEKQESDDFGSIGVLLLLSQNSLHAYYDEEQRNKEQVDDGCSKDFQNWEVQP